MADGANLDNLLRNEAGDIRPASNKDRHNEILKRFQAARADAEKQRLPHMKRWGQFYQGKQLISGQGLPRWKVVDNIIYTHVETALAQEVNASPKVFLEASSPLDIPALALNQAAWDNWWNTSEMRYKHVLMKLDAMLYGIGVGRVWYDGRAEPFPDVAVSAFNPFNFYWTPGAEDLDDCPEVFFLSLVSRHVIERRFGKAVADEIGANNIPSNMVAAPMSLREMGENAERGVLPGATIGDLVVVLEGYLNFGEEYVRMAGGKILYDGPNPFAKKHPVGIFRNSLLPHEFWSLSDVAKAESIQITLNRLYALILEHQESLGNGWWIYSRATGLDAGAFSAHRRRLISVAPGTVGEIKHEGPVPLAPGMFEMVPFLKNSGFSIMGTPDVLQGSKPGSPSAQVSGLAVAQISESAQTRFGVRLFLSILGLKRLARIVNGIQQEQYNNGQHLIPLLPEVAQSLSQAQMQGLLISQQQNQQGESFGPAFAQIAGTQSKPNPLRPQIPFRYRVESDEMFPINKTGRADMLLRMSEMLPRIPPPLWPTVLSAYGVSEAEKITEAFMQFQQQQLQQILASQAGQAAGTETETGLPGGQEVAGSIGPQMAELAGAA